MACGGMIFKTISNFRKKNFILFYYIFFIGYYCSLNIKRQSEHSGLCPDTSTLVPLINRSAVYTVQVVEIFALCF